MLDIYPFILETITVPSARTLLPVCPMKSQLTFVGLVAVILSMTPIACKRGAPASAIGSDGAAVQNDDSSVPADSSDSGKPEDAQPVDYAQMKLMYEQMAARYARMGDVGTDAEWMEQMAAQMGHLRSAGGGGVAGHPGRMGGRGRMGRSGRMGGRGRMGRSGTMGGRGRMGAAGSMDRWNAGMARLNEEWAQQARRNGNDELARMHDELARKHAQAAEHIAQVGAQAEAPASNVPPGAGDLDGAALFASHCAGCHGGEGQGVAGAFPPLRGELVTGGPEHVVRLVRGGASGPLQVQGAEYNGVMPSFDGRLSDAELASVLSYVRGSWGNDASAITAAQVSAAR